MSVCGPMGPGSDDDDEALMVALAKSLGDGGGGGGDAKKKKKKKSKEKNKWASKTDKLDLAGLLNVLDGVVDTPNRIVIMTTNHPEVSVQSTSHETYWTVTLWDLYLHGFHPAPQNVWQRFPNHVCFPLSHSFESSQETKR